MPHKDPEKRRQYQQEYREKNREKIRQWGRENYERTGKERGKKYREANRDAKRIRDALHLRKWRAKTRERIFEVLGDKCARCGFDDKRALQVDHINGGGTKEWNERSSSYKYYQRIIEVGLAEYQILCANCNQIKRYENNENRK